MLEGGGGASGSATLESIMEKLTFGPKPKIVDLTSERRIADKVNCNFLFDASSAISPSPIELA